MTDSLLDQAEQAIGTVVEAACPLCKEELRIHDGRAWLHLCGDTYLVARRTAWRPDWKSVERSRPGPNGLPVFDITSARLVECRPVDDPAGEAAEILSIRGHEPRCKGIQKRERDPARMFSVPGDRSALMPSDIHVRTSNRTVAEDVAILTAFNIFLAAVSHPMGFSKSSNCARIRSMTA